MDLVATTVRLQRQTRADLVAMMDELTLDQMLEIPPGFGNNILWNVGHVVVAHQGLTYRLAGLDPYVSEQQLAQFRRGSSPADWSDVPDVGALRAQLVELPDRFLEDYRADRFGSYQPYRTAAGITLETIEEALLFNQYHEGYHGGVIRLIRRAIGAL